MGVLTYLGIEYATIEFHKLKDNCYKLSYPFGMYKPLPVYIKILHDARDFSKEEEQLINGTSLVMVFYNHM